MAGLSATAIALLLGTALAFAVSRYSFFGRNTISLLVVLPISLPGIVTGIALNNAFTKQLGISTGLFTVIVGHATFCIVVVYNNAIARLNRMGTSLQEASMDLGANGVTTFRLITLPNLASALFAGGLLAFGLSFDEIEAYYKEMEDEGRAAIGASQIRPEEIVFERAADMRYFGQEHAVTVDLPHEFFVSKDRAAIKNHFDEVHKVRYGTSAPKEAADIVSLRVTVLGRMKKPPRNAVETGEAKPDAQALRAHKPVYFRSAGDFVDTPVYRRDLLKSGNEFHGPALVEEHASTTVVQPGDSVKVDLYGNLQISIGSDRT